MTNPTTFNIENIKRVFQQKGFTFYENGELNIIGIRNTEVGLTVTDVFDDWIVCIYKEGNEYRYFQWPVTTDPSRSWQLRPQNSTTNSVALGGAARLKPGQYNVHKIDKHRGDPTHWALCQRAGSVTVFRSIGDQYRENREDTGVFGINIHRHYTADRAGDGGDYIRGGSQGCQVFRRIADFNQLMQLCYSRAGGRQADGSPVNRNKIFTYTLILQRDLQPPYPQTNRSIGTSPSIPSYTATYTSTGPDPFTQYSGPGISPYIASLESFHPFIQYELTRRRDSTQMVNTYMPFVKLTSLTKVLKSNTEGGAPLPPDRPTTNADVSDVYCPSLGIHGKEEVSFEEIYNPKDNRSVVGYATQYKNNVATLVPVVVEDATKDPPNIPMPGITGMKTERNTAGPMGVRGGLFRATINIKAYSKGQVDTLLRYFLRPATRVILELGRKSSDINEEFVSDKYFQKFNWKRSLDDINRELEPLVTLKAGQRDFIEKYIYGNFGNYEIFIGYVVKFDLKYTKDNVYDITLTVHSLQQYEVPVTATGINSVNPSNSVSNECDSVDIIDYFNPPSSWRRNTFKNLMTRGKGVTTHAAHVIPLTGPGTAATSGGAQSPGYLITWQFFVDILLNDTDEGILSVFQLSALDENTKKFLESSVIKPIRKLQRGEGNSLNANEVSWSPSLRSTDPNVMIIYNPIAQRSVIETNAQSITTVLQSLGDITAEQKAQSELAFTTSQVKQRIMASDSPVGAFSEEYDGVSYLTKGIWINTNAIIDAFAGADTVSGALSKLLTSMNNATRGFWNLQLLSNDQENPGMHVIDMGSSKKPRNNRRNTNPQVPVPKLFEQISTIRDGDIERTMIETELGQLSGSVWKPNYLYLFNRKLQNIDEGLGGELLDISLESSLPQVIAVQAIAGVGGQTQRGTLNSIDIEQLRKISLYDVFARKSTTGCASPDSPCTDTAPTVPSRPSEVPQDYINAVTAVLEGQSNVRYRNETFTAESIETVKQTLIDEWKRTQEATICRQPEDNDPEKDAKIQACTDAGLVRKKIFDDYIDTLKNARRETYESNRPGYLELVKQYSGMFGMAIDLIESDVTKITKLLDREAQQREEQGNPHPFNSSNLTKTLVDITMPGIGGIQLFQSFGVDRVPSILDRGYYVVTKVDHEFGTDKGWTTKLQGRFRYNPPRSNQRVAETPCPDTPTSPSSTTTVTTTPPTTAPIPQAGIVNLGTIRGAEQITSIATWDENTLIAQRNIRITWLNRYCASGTKPRNFTQIQSELTTIDSTILNKIQLNARNNVQSSANLLAAKESAIRSNYGTTCPIR